MSSLPQLSYQSCCVLLTFARHRNKVLIGTLPRIQTVYDDDSLELHQPSGASALSFLKKLQSV